LAKGLALASPSERSERFEPLVRPGLRCAIVRATQNEKADTAELKLLHDKFNVLRPAIVLPCVLQRPMNFKCDAVLRLKRY